MSAVSRAFFVARNAEDKAKAIEARLANQTRLAKLSQTPGGDSKSSMLSFDQTLDAAGESAMFGTPDEIAEKLAAASRRGRRAHPAQRPVRLAREPAGVCARGDAGVRGAWSEGRRGASAAAAREHVVHKPVARPGGIPALIKRNTALLALSQSFIGAGTQLAYGIGPLMVLAVTGSASLAGLTVGLFGVSRFLVSYPIGQITDRFGRKPGILFGQGLAMLGTLLTGIGDAGRQRRRPRRSA